MKRHLPAFFASLAMVAMLGAVGIRVVQARRVKAEQAPLAWSEHQAEPRIHLSSSEGRVEWNDTAVP
jgi:xanthosine utilization system XapX-like protein